MTLDVSSNPMILLYWLQTAWVESLVSSSLNYKPPAFGLAETTARSGHSTWLTTLLCAISWRMLGVTRLQNSRAVRIAVKLNSFWFWTVGATAACSQYTVHSWANIKAWKREHMCKTDVWRKRNKMRKGAPFKHGLHTFSFKNITVQKFLILLHAHLSK